MKNLKRQQQIENFIQFINFQLVFFAKKLTRNLN
jgi:capsid portal protein